MQGAAMSEATLDRKIQQWEDKLLDLSKRNRMISYKRTKRSTLRILSPDFGDLYKRVAVDERELTFQKSIDRDSDARTYAILSLLDELSFPLEVNVGDIRVEGSNSEAQKTLKHLRSKSRLSLEEQGANILYLFFGFIEWREKGRDTWVKSPLISVPVSITLPSLHAHYVLKKYEDDVVVNPTLAYLFENEYGIKLPGFSPDDDSLENYLSQVENLVEDRGWQVSRECDISLASFLKISMYNDLKRNEGRLRANPLIKTFSGIEGGLASGALPADFDHDAATSLGEYQVLDADSSQQDAIALSRLGTSFVMQGPPGTGKSQTIANIIAQSLADGKRVLFVSEKMAALDVVWRRLEDAHLNDFCLALHSHKANKREIIQQLGECLDLKPYKVKSSELANLTQLDVVRERLRQYTESLHEPIMPLGISFYEAYGRLSERSNLPDLAHSISSAIEESEDHLYRMSSVVSSLDGARGALGSQWYKNPWRGITCGRLTMTQKGELQRSLQLATTALAGFGQCEVAGKALTQELSLRGLHAFFEICRLANLCRIIPFDQLERGVDESVKLVTKILELEAREKGLVGEISSRFKTEICDVDATSCLRKYSETVGFCLSKLGALAGESVFSCLEDIYGELVEAHDALRGILDFTCSAEADFGIALDSISSIDRFVDVAGRLNVEERNLTSFYFEDGSAIRLRDMVSQAMTEWMALKGREDELAEQVGERLINDIDASLLLHSLEELAHLREGFGLSRLPELDELSAAANVSTTRISEAAGILRSESCAVALEAVGLPPALSIDSLLGQITLIEALMQAHIPPTWSTAAERAKAKALLAEAIRCKEKERDLAAQVAGLFAQTSVSLDHGNLTEDDVSLLEAICTPIPALETTIAACSNERAISLLGDIDDKINEAHRLKDQISTACSAAGITGPVDEGELRQALIECLSSGGAAPVPESWAYSPHEVHAFLERIANAALAYEDRRNLLLEHCEESALSLDATSILGRFKTEYTGLLKSFNREYKQDIKSIQLILKDARRKISDDEAVDLLLRIRQCQESEARYLGFASEATQLLGIPRLGLDVNWSKTKARFEAFRSLASFFYSGSAAVRFIESGSLKPMLELLEKRADSDRWFSDCALARETFGSLYQEATTDVELIREAMDRAHKALAAFPSSDDCVSALSDPSCMQQISQALVLASEAISCRRWLEENQDEIEAATLAGGKSIQDLQTSVSALKSYAFAAEELGDEETLGIATAIRENAKPVSVYLTALKEMRSAIEELNEDLFMGNLSTSVLEMGLEDFSTTCKDMVQISLAAKESFSIVAAHAKAKRMPLSANELERLLREVAGYQSERSRLRSMEGLYRTAIGEDYLGADTDWGRVEDNLSFAGEIVATLGCEITERLVAALVSSSGLRPQTLLDEIHQRLTVIAGFSARYPDFAARQENLTPALQMLSEGLAVAEKAVLAKKTITHLSFGPVDEATFLSALETLAQLQKTREKLSDELAIAAREMPYIEVNSSTSWSSIADALRCAAEVRKLELEAAVPHEIVTWAAGGLKELEPTAYNNEIDTLSHAHSKITDIVSAFDSAETMASWPLDKLNARLCRCLDMFHTLDDWIELRDCLTECEKYGLAEFARESEDAYYEQGTLKEVFLKSFYTKWMEQACSSVPAISSFRSRVHEEKIAEFRALDERQQRINRERIRERLLSDMPSRSNARTQHDELGTLLHELGKRSRHMPLRKLFRAIPNLLLTLKPCLMMSPLSVSYFLEAETYKFDLVIFDEASQIFPQDAIGAILRGSQVVIAGDSKQLPPTNFFTSSANNDSDYDVDDEEFEEQDFDSILEEAANCLPNRQLMWHYRSRSEDLIAFSNQKIYGGNLITFPSCLSGAPNTGVEYVYVKGGIYEDRCNRDEARRIVGIIAKHIEEHPERSLGVIAFSEKQQSVIEGEVDKFRAQNPKYESFFSEEKEEPFFVKNLENVQGDERDTIIFSICYGKNAQGRMYMRFGPLGHQGGERRLNVAITRAKHNVKLVGSILPDDIDPSRTNSAGVRLLRSYILFAINGSSVLERRKKGSQIYEADSFREAVREHLSKQGYVVKTDVGCSDYTIDMAIEDPERPGRYCAGIECDGESYLAARTVRDRDRLRSSVLSGMGWNMHRVWSTEWIRNPELEKSRLEAFLDDALEKTEIGDETEWQPSLFEDSQIEIGIESHSYDHSATIDPDNPYGFEEYVEAAWYEAKLRRGRDDASRAADMIHWIVEVEQPIHADLLYRRMAGAFGNEKATKTVRENVDYIIRNRMNGELSLKDGFYTLAGFEGAKARRSSPEWSGRSSMDYISIEEIAYAMVEILKGAYGMDEAALCSEAAAVFGFERVGPKIRQRTMEAVKHLEKAGMVNVLDGKVQLS